MKVFKFGGASVKDANGVRNVAKVLEQQGFKNCLLVISAMGKTTNALEKVIEYYFNKGDFQKEIDQVKKTHIEIVSELFPAGHSIFSEVELFFDDIIAFLRRNKSPNYNYVYDQVVSYGEIVSTKIVSEFLNHQNFENLWLDARDYIKTDNSYREGVVNWTKTEILIQKLPNNKCYVTQGFIGSDDNNFTVTLGREGSDYSGAIFAYCMNAESMTIWKDVPGVMTGDPRKFDNVELLNSISYEEAIEMAYYGASVIHPKTLQPLKQKKIPFYVKSFIEPEKPGTKIEKSENNQTLESYIVKENQTLIKISTRDFSFIAEEHLSSIFSTLSQLKIRVSLLQNSAISLALCLEDKFGNFDTLGEVLQKDFKIDIIKNVSLFTIRNTKIKDIEKFYADKVVVMEQISNKTIQLVIKN